MALVAFLVVAPVAIAGNDGPLFVNLTTDEPHRALMGLQFSKSQLARKHPVTVFLNDRGAMLGSKSMTEKFREQQEALASLVKDGAQILVCAMCMKHYAVTETDLPDGLKVSNPDLPWRALLDDDDTKALTWWGPAHAPQRETRQPSRLKR